MPTLSDTANTPIKCEFCGKKLKPKFVELMGVKHHIGYELCGCEESVKAAEAEEAKRRESKEQAIYQQKQRQYMRAGIPPRYLDAVTDDEILTDHVKSGTGIYIQGPVGVGKTYTAMAIARRIIDAGKTVFCTSSLGILTMIRSTFNGNGTEEDVFLKLIRPYLLVINDMGKENANPWVVSMIYRVIDDRYQNLLPVVITSNYSKQELIPRLTVDGDSTTAEAIVSRLFEMTIKHEMTGGDRRLGNVN